MLGKGEKRLVAAYSAAQAPEYAVPEQRPLVECFIARLNWEIPPLPRWR